MQFYSRTIFARTARTFTTSAPTGLRERKKEATRLALHQAAVRLAVEQGLDRLAVEAIADAATVSRRTFSNYFASKEEALLYGDQACVRHLIDLVAGRPAEETPWTALSRAARRLTSEGPREPGRESGMRLLRRHESLLSQQVATYAIAESGLADTIRVRTPMTPFRARLMAATFLTTLRVAVRYWLDEPDANLESVLDEALEAVQDEAPRAVQDEALEAVQGEAPGAVQDVALGSVLDDAPGAGQGAAQSGDEQ